MDSEEFRRRGREVLDFIIEYHRTISERKILHSKKYGYLRELIPYSAPVEPESFDKMMNDLKNYIMPGIVHWRHPRYFGYFPSGSSYPSILANMLISGLNCLTFSWAAGPACTELEIVITDWLGKMLGLPEEFIGSSSDRGGGVLQLSTADATLVCMLAARHAKTKELNRQRPSVDRRRHVPFYVAYCSKICHSTIVKAAEVAMVQVRLLEVDDKFQLRGETLNKAMTGDREKGLIPFFVFASLGSAAFCSMDALDEIGPVCEEFGVWLHVDAAYAGCALVCPEFRHLLKGIQFVHSIAIDPSMWMLVNIDCCAMWVRDRFKLTESLAIDPSYLQHAFIGTAIDYRNWGIPLSRRFRALQLWFVLRMYGVEGLQSYIRKHIYLAKVFENFVRDDDRFVVENEVSFGLVCFRLKGSNVLNKKLLSQINATGDAFLVGTMVEGNFVLFFCLCSENSKREDVAIAWEIVSEIAGKILSEENATENHSASGSKNRSD